MRLVQSTALPYLLILGVCLLLLMRAFSIPEGPDGQLGADIWPKAILVLAIATCAWELVRNFMGAGVRGDATSARRIEEPPGEPVDDPLDKVPPWLPWAGIALTVGYAAMLTELGYFLATLVFTAAFVYFGNYRRPAVALAVAGVAALAFVFVFMKIVYVALPLGHEPFARLSALVMALMGIR